MRFAVLILALMLAAPAIAQVKPDTRPGDEPTFEDVPRTPSGKIQKFKLREAARQ